MPPRRPEVCARSENPGHFSLSIDRVMASHGFAHASNGTSISADQASPPSKDSKPAQVNGAAYIQKDGKTLLSGTDDEETIWKKRRERAAKRLTEVKELNSGALASFASWATEKLIRMYRED